MCTELNEIERKMHKEWGKCYTSKEILLSDRWIKNKNFAANRKIGAISRLKKKSGVEFGYLKPFHNSDNNKKEGSLNLGDVFKLVEQDDDFPSVSIVSKIISEKDMSLDLTIGDNFRDERLHLEKTASCLPAVNISTVPRMGPEKSKKKNELVRTNISSPAVSDTHADEPYLLIATGSSFSTLGSGGQIKSSTGFFLKLSVGQHISTMLILLGSVEPQTLM